MPSGETYLYSYVSASGNEVYIGIGDSIERAWGAHNPNAERLLRDPGTRVFQTYQKFTTRRDARLAEAMLILVIASAGKAAISVDEDGEVVTTNRSGVKSSSLVGAAIMAKQGTVDYLSLRETLLVPISPEQIDARPALHGGSGFSTVAERATQWWKLARIARGERTVNRLIAVLRGRNVILGDWDIDMTEPVDEGDEGWWQVNLVDPSDDDPRGVKGMTLNFGDEPKMNQGHRYSKDQSDRR